MRKPIPPVKWWSPAIQPKQTSDDDGKVGAIEYLWRKAQTAFTIEQHEDYTIALRILWALREGSLPIQSRQHTTMLWASDLPNTFA